ncbi:hypothetical protein BDZ94DRAFT_1354388 [Collybia nuda]|uniref:Ketoreductase domain-containing protein n=1 Tax=Collybia nuda TaxID=64659 RepID=A0A9P5YB62_9AGAR|nr:hypothetical protein BDZ94DRAFT_1354388 [Collybia nuda]
MLTVFIVTGASKGLGLAVTRILLHKFNAKVVALSRSRTPELHELAKSDNLLVVECDVSDEVALTKAITDAEINLHHIDGLVLNAGTLDPMCLIGDDTPLSAWKHHFDVNFFSLVTALKATLPALRRSELGGRIVFVSSGAALKGTIAWAPYSAGKAAMNSLCRTLSEEEPSIVSVAIRPGMVDTNMQTQIRQNGASLMTEKDHQIFKDVHSSGKLVKPEDAGHVIAALALQAHKHMSGRFMSWDSEECKEFKNSGT